MDDRFARLESTVDQLRSAVGTLQQRLDVLEAARPGAALPGAGAVATEAAPAPPLFATAALAQRDPYDPIVVLTLIGRLFLVLAGGFFLRAMTEAGLLAPRVGIALAFAYGLVWLLMADRAGRRQQFSSAVFHALAAAMVAFPLLVEATTRFKVLGSTGSALGITVLTSGLLFVAWRRRLSPVAWVTVLAALPTSLVLLLKTGVIAPFALYLITLGIATLWLGYSLGWTKMRWPVALAADAVVAGVTLRALSPEHQDVTAVALALQWALLGAYVVSIAIRTLVRGRNVTPFEIVQTAVALLIAFAGALVLTRATGTLPATIGIASLVCGAACYGLAVAFVDRRRDVEWNLYFYTTLALVLVLAGLVLALGGEWWPGAVFALLGVLAVALWSRAGRPYLLFHGATYLVAAGIVSGALSYGAWALAAGPAGPWVSPGAVVLVVLLASAVSARLVAARANPEGGAPASGLRLVIILVLVWVGSGWVIGHLAPVAAGLADRAVDLGALATVRTAVLAVAALLIAWLGRQARFREWAWLVYPMLVGIGLKMVVQDFQHSRPATLFIALALYGAALIVAPRLRRVGAPVVWGAAA